MHRAQTKQRRPTSRNGRTHHPLVDYFRGGRGPVGLRGGGLTGVCDNGNGNDNGTGETLSGLVKGKGSRDTYMQTLRDEKVGRLGRCGGSRDGHDSVGGPLGVLAAR